MSKSPFVRGIIFSFLFLINICSCFSLSTSQITGINKLTYTLTNFAKQTRGSSSQRVVLLRYGDKVVKVTIIRNRNGNVKVVISIPGQPSRVLHLGRISSKNRSKAARYSKRIANVVRQMIEESLASTKATPRTSTEINASLDGGAETEAAAALGAVTPEAEASARVGGEDRTETAADLDAATSEDDASVRVGGADRTETAVALDVTLDALTLADEYNAFITNLNSQPAPIEISIDVAGCGLIPQ
ncbi:hypothetical protein SC029_09230 [Legionella pneumophila serogroup 1]|uniref:hypothetical protein n=1 Tax=Legionella pneumophila TaxID=446 RepID=UPI000488C336|nr:hypothetical protein [Legionella pneumophila]VEB32363.1 Uncharacterised protein [Legionella pneumophila]HAT1941365.1 hypothetical protein [Legionella pneumophila]HAT3860448.1 hypothetical protein [Legionella pneumophila]HAT8688931.1 hypothetical protein [Legionella pneumophila]HAT8727214.1 hypothetical protein [Legionella pneumophila]